MESNSPPRMDAGQIPGASQREATAEVTRASGAGNDQEGRRSTWKIGWALLYGVVCGFLGAGLLWLIATRPSGEPISLPPPPTPAPFKVHVLGAVEAPGVYEFRPGSRVAEALQAAGGLLDAGQTTRLNLAAPLEDGQQIYVPTAPPEGAPGPDQLGPAGSTPPVTAGGRIDINSASAETLETLPGIGPVTAGKIVAYREENGAFREPADLLLVSGIGPATLERIEPLITVGP